MNKRSLEEVLEAIVSQPTAPFHEYHVRAAIQKQLAGVKGVKMMEDSFGNLIVRYKRGRSKPRWALGAHMDHPGWVRTKGGGCEFLGGVPEAYRAANMDRIQWFDAFGVWDIPAYERWNGSVIGRACDDLVGCSILVSVLREMSKRETNAHFYALFTRAEEVGFLGISKMLEEGAFPADVSFLSLETSAAVEGAVKDGGPIIRVGDRLSVFDQAATAELEAVAQTHKIPFQRLLLDRGACEASAVQAHGIPSTGLSVLLENYHNCGEGSQIVPEKVEVDDIFHVVKLLLALVGEGPQPDLYKKLRARIGDLNKKHAVHERGSRHAWEM
jgi:endoglucanase